MFVAWLTHTSGDWLQRIPGVTGIALAAAAVLLSLPRRDVARADEAPRLRTPRALVLLALAYGVIVFAAVEVARPTLALHYRSEAQRALADNPARALTRANQALELNGQDIPVYYVKAAAYARYNRYDSARSALLEALRREPFRFVTWGLLGDLAFRRGDFREARRAYARASQLNPRDPTLARRVHEARTRAARAR
jgi:cytochrome c-type biogenesis protein CcmH/NrfG